MRWILLSSLVVACAHSASPEVTQTGDIIGTATMAEDRSIRLVLVSVDCSRLIAHGDFTVSPAEPRHAEIVRHIGGIEPGEIKPVPAWPTPPCR